MQKKLTRIKTGYTDILKKIYADIDAECISETDTVKMENVSRVLIKYGAIPQDME